MRLRNVKGSRETIAANDYVVHNETGMKGHWHELFDNDNPIHIEIGMGKGQFIMELARRNPDINYIGIEKYSSVLVRALEKRELEPEMTNLYFIRMDAEYITDVFDTNEVDRIYLNFSDPWPKDRHAKRRLPSRQFLARYDEFLKEYAAVSAYRAWAYLQLALLYGEIPFYTQPLLSYSEIEQVMNDPSRRKGLGEICSYFIDDLLPYVDVPFPNYGNFTYDQNSSVNSSDFFLPIRLLRGDLYLWRGSLDGNKSDFAKAAQEYRDYLLSEERFVNPEIKVAYRTVDLDGAQIVDRWNSVFVGGNTMERISLVPFAGNSQYGKLGSLQQSFRYFMGSDALQKLVDESYYCYVMYTEESESDESEYMSRFTGLAKDTLYYGTKENPQYYSYITVPGTPQYFMGDLRFNRDYQEGYGLSINKYSSLWPHVTTYRTGAVYLRLAEAINRAGYPLTAFHVLKYGLSRGNLIQYDANGEYRRLMQSGYTFYDMYDNKDNMGLHARGCGNAEMDTLHYALPAMASREDSIRKVGYDLRRDGFGDGLRRQPFLRLDAFCVPSWRRFPGFPCGSPYESGQSRPGAL